MKVYILLNIIQEMNIIQLAKFIFYDVSHF
jgi:hypothetical protein